MMNKLQNFFTHKKAEKFMFSINSDKKAQIFSANLKTCTYPIIVRSIEKTKDNKFF